MPCSIQRRKISLLFHTHLMVDWPSWQKATRPQSQYLTPALHVGDRKHSQLCGPSCVSSMQMPAPSSAFYLAGR